MALSDPKLISLVIHYYNHFLYKNGVDDKDINYDEHFDDDNCYCYYCSITYLAYYYIWGWEWGGCWFIIIIIIFPYFSFYFPLVNTVSPFCSLPCIFYTEPPSTHTHTHTYAHTHAHTPKHKISNSDSFTFLISTGQWWFLLACTSSLVKTHQRRFADEITLVWKKTTTFKCA